jgi:DNA-binding PadR family transcriptional regulator
VFEKRREQARQLILEALRDGSELPGWDLVKKTKLSTGRLYPALAELEQTEQVTSRWGDENGPKPRRRYYRLADQAGGR